MDLASLNLTRAMEEMLAEPLPSPWSYGVTSDGRVFFINEELHTTTWLHPLYNHPVQTGFLFNHALPNGWEVSLASSNVPFFIDHLNHVTTFQSPIEGSPAVTKSKERKSFRFQRSSSKRKSGKQKVIDKMASVKRDSDAPVSCKGWITRQEGMGPLKSWKRRWCVLADFCLFIYKSPDEGQTLGSIILPSFKINPCFKDEDGVSKKYAFKAEHENVKTAFFSVDTEEEMALWMEALRAAASAEFHTVDDSRLRFARSQSHNEINSPRTYDSQNSPDPRGAEAILDVARYPKRQNSMPSGMDMVRNSEAELLREIQNQNPLNRITTEPPRMQDMQAAKPRLEVQDTRPDNGHPRPAAGTSYSGGDDVVRDSIPAKSSGYWNQKAPRQNSEHKNMSSSSDEDFRYMKDLNLTQSSGHNAKGSDSRQVVGPPRNDYVHTQPIARNQIDVTPLSGRDPTHVAPAHGSKGELNELGQVRYRQQIQTVPNERPSALPRHTEPVNTSRGPTSQGELSQKPLTGSINTPPYSSGGPDPRYMRSAEQNINSAGRDSLHGRHSLHGSEQKPLNVSMKYDPGAKTEFFRNGNQPTAINSEAELLREMQNPLNRVTTEPSRMHGMTEVPYGAAPSSLAFNRSLNDSRVPNPGEKLTSGSEGSREKGSEASSGKVDEWSVKRLEVQKPLSRVEEWTMEQMRQQQEKQSLESRKDGQLDRERDSNFDSRHQRQFDRQGNLSSVEKRWPEESAARQGTTRTAEPTSPIRTNPLIGSNSFGGVGASGPVPMPRKQLPGNQMHATQLPGNQMQNNEIPEDRLQGIHMQGSQLGRSQMPGIHAEGNRLQGNQMDRGQIHLNQRSHLSTGQKHQMDNNSETSNGRPSANDSVPPNRNSSVGLTSRPVLTASQNDLINSNAPTSFRMDSATQSRQNNDTTPSGETFTYFTDVNRLLVDHSKLRHELATGDGNGQQLNMDDLIGRLIQLRRSQTKLEESRYWLLGQMHQQFTQSTQGTAAAQRVPAKALQDKLIDIEQELTKTVSLVAELDRRLTSLRSKELMGVLPSGVSAPAPEQNVKPPDQTIRTPETGKELSSSAMSVKEKDADLEKRLQDIYVMQRQVEQESFFVNNLREEKSKLEKALSKAQRDEELERDPNQLMRLRRQKQAIDRELYGLQTKLTYAVRNLDEIKRKYSEMEHEATVLRKQNYDKASGTAPAKPPVFVSIPGETTVKSYDAGAASPGSEGTYYETDLDTGRSRDLAAPKDTATAESQDRNNVLAGPKPSAFLPGRGIGVPVKSNVYTSVHSNNAETTVTDSSKGRFPEISRLPRDVNRNSRDNLNTPTDFKLQGSSDEKRFHGDIRVEELSQTSDHIPRPENLSVRQRWPPDQTTTSRTGFQPGSEQRSQDDPSERSVVLNRSQRDEFSVGGNGGRVSDIPSTQIVTKSQPTSDPRAYQTGQLGRARLGFNASATQPEGVRSDSEPLRPNNILSRLLGSGQPSTSYGQPSTTYGQPSTTYGQPSMTYGQPSTTYGQPSTTYGQPSTTYGQPLAMEAHAGSVPGGVKPSKPPRQTGEDREWEKEADRNVNYRLRPLTGQASAMESSRRPGDEWQKTPNLHLDFSGVESKPTVAERQKSGSAPRGPVDDPAKRNYSPENFDRTPSRPQEAERDQSSPTSEFGPRDHIRRLSGFFTPKPFRGGSTVPGSAKLADETSGYSSSAKAGSSDPTSPLDQAFGQRIDGIFHAPQKIDIPERYSEDADNEAPSPDDILRRREKSEKLRKMVAAQSLQEFSKGELTAQTGGLQYRVQDERRRREQMLDTRQMLAEQVIRRTHQGSDNSNRARNIEDLLKDSDDGQYL